MDDKKVSKVRYDELKSAFEEFRKDNIELRKQVELWKNEYKKEVEQHQGHDELAHKYKCALNEIEQLKREYNCMMDEIERLKKQLDKQTKNNAGRKPLKNDIVEKVHNLKMNNISIRDIQKTLSTEGINISVGAIHKTIQRLLP